MPPRKAAALVSKEPAPLQFADLSGFVRLVEDAEVTLEAADNEEGRERRLEALVAALPAEAHEDLWRRVLDAAGDVLRGPPPGVAGEEGAAGADAEGAADGLPARALHAVAALLSAFATAALPAGGTALPPSFAEALGLCQEMLLSIPNSVTQALVARALESIVLSEYEGREDYYGGVLMYLIGACVSPRTTAADVARLHRVKHLFADLDWEHESIESMKMQIMRCVACPSFLRSSHSSELLALFFTVHPGFTAEVHSTVKNQVTFCRQGAVKSYAAALHKAWKLAEAGTRVQLEECIQEWILLAIRTVRKSADRARQVLEEIHRHHHEDEMNDLLCRLYGPVLWRSLKVANWQVRENAAKLLQYTFPLIPSDLNVAEKEQELVRQLRILREALQDPAEPVRRVAVSVVCTILKNYWDILPPGETAELLTALYSRCAHDKKAPTVRAAVCEGLGWVLQNPLSHPTLAAVLPNLAELLNDRAPLVRAAFVGLLDIVSHCRGVSVSSVVKTDDLFLRLASEHAEGQAERLQSGLQPPKKVAAADGLEVKATPELVARRLAKLMAPSLFTADIVQQVTRCVYFLKQSPLALLALLSHSQDVVPLAERVKLAAALFRYGLREAGGASAETEEGCRSIATMLRVVGVLLEGAASEVVESADVPKKRKKGAAPTGSFGADVEKFLYEHIKEADFIQLLKDSSAAVDLRKDLLFALAALDPKRLPRTAALVQSELTAACRDGGEGRPLPQLAALVRTASRWGLLATCLEAAWERLHAAAGRLGRRQAPAADLQGALTVVEAAFREPDVRVAMLKTEAGIVRETVEALSKAFASSWAKGVAEVACPGKNDAAVLAQAADAWPRVMGFMMRAALHLDHRMAPSPTDGTDRSKDDTSKHPFAHFADRTLEVLASALTSENTVAVLDSLQAAQSKAAGAPAEKRAKAGAMAVTDLVPVLAVHERLLEAICAASQLSVLRLPGKAAGAEEPAGAPEASDLAALLRTVEAVFWRWSVVAEAQCPSPGSLKLGKAWAFSGRLLQLTSASLSAAELVPAFQLLLSRTTGCIPVDEDLRRVIHHVLARLAGEPELVRLTASILGEAGGEPSLEVHGRVREVFEDSVHMLRKLRTKLASMPEALPLKPPPACDAGLAPVTEEEGGISGMESDARRSARSRSPPPRSDSLFGHCFRGRASSVATRSLAGSVGGQDVD